MAKDPKLPGWVRPDANGANHWGGSNGGLQGRGQRRGKSDSCCSYERAADAAVRGNFRLAKRFIQIDVKTRLGVMKPIGA
jgi:hypothetical protein